MGATVSSETTAAAEGPVGELRRDPFAMLPFCGYNMADYWQHWLNIGANLEADKLPRIFQVNWFRKDANGKFMWPGFGDNSRVVEWIAKRIEGLVELEESAIGGLPFKKDFNLDGLDVSDEKFEQIFDVDSASWQVEARMTREYFAEFGDRVPQPLRAELAELESRLAQS
jgi:phosphoenolpyruvate carboxykinase (GTP)